MAGAHAEVVLTLDWLREDGGDDQPTLSVVLPSYRAAEILAREVPQLLTYLDRLGVGYEVVISDDGSRDDGATRRAAEALGCVYVGSDVNRGKGAAVRLGMTSAIGRYRLFTDADIPFELEVIEQALYYLAFKEFDVVVGDRRMTESTYYGDVLPIRRVGSKVYTWLTSWSVTGGWYDTQCGFKGFRGDVAESLYRVARIDRFAADAEILYLAMKRNYDVKRLPVKLRNQARSSVRVVRDGARMVWDLARIRYHEMRGHYHL